MSVGFGLRFYAPGWLRAPATSDMGRKVLNDLERVSPILLEMGYWETFVCVWTSQHSPF